MDFPLEGLNALVGGASRGIGRGCATALAAAGANVTAMARDERALDAVVSQLPTPTSQVHEALVADSSDWRATGDAVRALVSRRGIVEILVHNTGGPAPGQAAEADPVQFDEAFDMHILSGQALVRALVPAMKDKGFGRIVNIISTSVVTPLPDLGVSNTIRGAVAQWGRTLASELGPFGITVNNVLPGSIETSRLRQTMERMADLSGDAVEEIRARTIGSIPAGRLGVPADIGNVVAFLASPAAEYVNGVNLPVDGGKTAVQ